MTWFKVDDGFYDHPKVKSLPRGTVRKGAVSLWLLAGSWCARYLQDGLIPGHQLEEFGASMKDAEALVAAVLWHGHGHGCDECPPVPRAHYLFHEWSAHQPLREQVEAEKRAARERMNKRRRAAKPLEATAAVRDLFARTVDEHAVEQ